MIVQKIVTTKVCVYYLLWNAFELPKPVISLLFNPFSILENIKMIPIFLSGEIDSDECFLKEECELANRSRLLLEFNQYFESGKLKD